MLTFDTDGMVVQQFPFPAPIMDYIFKNLQPQHLIKLYKCCKFFYAKYRQNIIRNLEIVDKGEPEIFDPIKSVICAMNQILPKLEHFWITDSFIYRAPLTEFNIIPQFSHCTIKKLEACDNLGWNEYEALTKAGTVEELKIGRIYRNGVLVLIEDIIAAIPNAKSIEITENLHTPTSFAALSALNHQVKITKFVLGNIDNTFRIKDVFNFLDNHVDVDCVVRFDYKKLIEDNDDILRAYNESMERIGDAYSKLFTAHLKTKKKKAQITIKML